MVGSIWFPFGLKKCEDNSKHTPVRAARVHQRAEGDSAHLRAQHLGEGRRDVEAETERDTGTQRVSVSVRLCLCVSLSLRLYVPPSSPRC